MTFWLYLYVFFFVTVLIDFTANKKQTRVNGTTIVLSSLMVLLVGFRGDMGTDINSYIRVFNDINPCCIAQNNIASVTRNFVNIEPLYAYLIYVFKLFSSSYNLFIAFYAAIIIFIYIKAFAKLKLPINIALFAFFSINFLEFFAQQRMAAVYALALLAFAYLNEDSTKKFFFIVFLATLVQYMGIFIALGYFLKKWPAKLSSMNEMRLPSKSGLGGITLSHSSITINRAVATSGIISIIVFAIAVITFVSIGSRDLLNLTTYLPFTDLAPLLKLTSYLSRFESNGGELLGKLGALVIHLGLVLGFIYYRNAWSTPWAGLAVNWYFWGIILNAFFSDFVWIAYRIFAMFNVTLIILYALIWTFPVRLRLLLLSIYTPVLIYFFYQQILSETGPYITFFDTN
jgi:hypothetical protein